MEIVGRAEDPFLEGYTSLGFLAGRTSTIEMGLGASWYDREHTALGIPYPPLSARFEMLEETLQICAQMWSGDNGPYDGRHYRLGETICVPQPICRPPVLIGGDGERKTLRLVAQYADAWNSTTSDVGERAHKIDVLHRHCDAVGRDPAEIRKTVGVPADPFAASARS